MQSTPAGYHSLNGMPPYDFDFAPPDYRVAVLQKIWHRASEGSIQHIRILAELGCLDEDE